MDSSVLVLVLSTALGPTMSADGRVGKMVQRIGLIGQEVNTWFMQKLVAIEETGRSVQRCQLSSITTCG